MKTKTSYLSLAFALLALSTINFQPSTAFAQGTTFTYQGRLDSGGVAANGLYDFRFKLAVDALDSANVGSAFVTNAIPVTNGLFVTTVDFGAGIFTGSNYWLEVDVRTNNPANTLLYTMLTPLQALTPTPYAVFAGAAGSANNASNLLGNIPVAQLSGTVPLAQLPVAVVTNNEASVTLNNVTVGGSLNLAYPATIRSGLFPFLTDDAHHNFFAGINAGADTTSGQENVAIGEATFYQNTSGFNNTAIGTGALNGNLVGDGNVAAGFQALANSTNDSYLVAIGYQALMNDRAVGYGNSGNGENTAVGHEALQLDTTGYGNTAVGYQALNQNTNGYENTASGDNALAANTSGGDNTAYGADALQSNTNGTQNTADGTAALYHNTSGSDNTANGADTLLLNTSGYENTGDGAYSLYSLTTGINNIALGYYAGYYLTNGNNNIDIGNLGVAPDAGIIRLGTQGIQTKTFVAGISGATAASGVAVYVNSSGQLGTLTSSKKFKQNIQSMADASDVLLALRPVTFKYKPEFDPQGIPQFGLVAEEVDKLDPDLVARDDKNQIYTVRYEAVNAMLLNEFLKQHQKVEEQNSEIQNLEKQLNELQAAVKSLAEKK